MTNYIIFISKYAQKQFKRLPKHIQQAYRVWSELIENYGIENMRKILGYHDEPLGKIKDRHA